VAPEGYELLRLPRREQRVNQDMASTILVTTSFFLFLKANIRIGAVFWPKYALLEAIAARGWSLPGPVCVIAAHPFCRTLTLLHTLRVLIVKLPHRARAAKLGMKLLPQHDRSRDFYHQPVLRQKWYLCYFDQSLAFLIAFLNTCISS
jgi:hypothetical protein